MRLPARPLLLALSLALNATVTQAASLAVGDGHTLIVDPQGRVQAFGRNEAGQLGNGSTAASAGPLPVPFPAGSSIASVAAGPRFSLALATDGKLWAWGKNNVGQLGVGAAGGDSAVPQPVALPAGVTATAIAAAGITYDDGRAAALGSDGRLYVWGNNAYAFLGNAASTSAATPQALPLATGVDGVAVAVGGDHGLLLDRQGRVYQWGHDFNEYVGLPGSGTLPLPVPIALPGQVKATAIAAGDRHAVALGEDGRVYVWGSDDVGQRGDGSAAGKTLVTAAALPAGVRATAIAAGSLHTLALGSDGQLYAWGDNDYAQLGNGQGRYLAASGPNASAVQAPAPVTALLPAATALSALAASRHSAAVGSDGRLYTWGANYAGELGYATTPEFLGLTPQPVAGVTVAGNRWAGAALKQFADCLFNWLEGRYSPLLGQADGTRTLAPYTFRHYAGSGSYLGLTDDSQHLYYLGPASAGSLADLGALSQWQGDSGCR